MSDNQIGEFPELSSIGSNIRAARLARGMTQARLAGEDVTRNMLSRIENGAALPSLPTLCAIASRLGVPAGALIGNFEDYNRYHLVLELKKLASKKKYSQLIQLYAGSGIAEPGEELSAILCTACTERASELFSAGRLHDALELLSEADSHAKRCQDDSGVRSERIFILRTFIETCPAYTSDNNSGAETNHEAELSRLSEIIFNKNEAALYLFCREQMNDVADHPYSEPHKHAAELRRNLMPLIEPLKNELFRTHLLARLDMADSDYLEAKARLLTLSADDRLPPTVLYELYTDLELCCKCCGDFQNAYRYSGLRLELLKRIS